MADQNELFDAAVLNLASSIYCIAESAMELIEDAEFNKAVSNNSFWSANDESMPSTNVTRPMAEQNPPFDTVLMNSALNPAHAGYPHGAV